MNKEMNKEMNRVVHSGTYNRIWHIAFLFDRN